MSDEHMWLIPFTECSSHQLRIHLRCSTPVTGLRLWNYNKSLEDTYRGVSKLSSGDINAYNPMFTVGTHIAVVLSLSHSWSGGWVTAPILSRKLHRRLGSL